MLLHEGKQTKEEKKEKKEIKSLLQKVKDTKEERDQIWLCQVLGTWDCCCLSSQACQTFILPETCTSKRQIIVSLLSKALQPDPTYALTAGSAGGEMRAFSWNFLTCVNFSPDLASSQCDTLSLMM